MKRGSADRFTTAIEKAREKRKSASALSGTMRHASAAAAQALMSQNTRRRSPARLMGENSQRLYFIPVDDVDYIEADGNYVHIHVGDQKYVRRDTLKRLASALRDAEFEYIRRSTLINFARVLFAEKLRHGAVAFTLSSGARLVSRTGIRRGLMQAAQALHDRAIV
jgi:two-component system, LytTR family, response regulator